MDAKKSGLLSRFTLQIATAFFLFISVLLLTASFQGRVIFQGFNHVGVVNSSASIVSSWPFTFPAKPNSSANAFGVALGKVNSDRNGSLGSVRQNAPEGGRESNGSLPVAGIADAGEQNTTTSKEADRSNNGYVKQSIEDSYQNCDIFDGRWERDESKPYYPAGSCPHIDRDFDCHANGRPDSGFVKWRWQPNRCDVPRYCDYNCTVDFVGSPFLVRESLFSSANGTVDTLRLDLMDKTTSMYHDADIIVFNTGHWWTHEKTSKGENYYQEGDYVHKRLKVLEAYKRALKTWGRWVDRSIDTNRTHVFFRGYSVTHFKGGQWNSGGKCHKETEPIFNTTHLAKYPSKMKVLENVLHEMKTPVAYLNISRLTDHRKDGHPSIYRKKYDTPEELLAAERSQDCSHWCLPGVPDTWNELLYASMLKAGIGS
ncbi:Protein trichome birefringence-like 2 [Linum perenne]